MFMSLPHQNTSEPACTDTSKIRKDNLKLSKRMLMSLHQRRVTLKFLSIGTPKIINFPFVSNVKINGF